MAVAAPANYLPGRALTTAIALGALTVAAAFWCLRDPAHRPPLPGLLAALPVALLVFVPFLANGAGGILGVSLNNDMSVHLWYAEAIVSAAVADVAPLPADYPLGPHALVATISEGTGIGVDRVFTGLTMALPVLSAWLALAIVRRATWLRQVLVATVVGSPFLIAAYYGQGSFKELLQAGLVLAVALSLAGYGPALGRGRWVPFALLSAGMLSVYSVTGLPWPLLLLGAWAAVAAALLARRSGWGEVRAAVTGELPSLGIGLGVFFLAILPQLPRLFHYISARPGINAGIPESSLGNLYGPLSGWEAFGVWTNPDYRLPASEPFLNGMLTALVLALVALGVVWALRRGRWMLPVAAGGAMLIWAVSTQTQSPYVTAKALVIASPLLLVLAVLPLVDGRRWRPAWLAVLAGVALFALVGVSDVRALRSTPVGPTDHATELRGLRSYLAGRPTLFLGNDDFIQWELAGTPLGALVLGGTPLDVQPQKEWAFGQALDFDSADPELLNLFEFVITTRDAAGSAPPENLKLVRTTPSYEVWRRTGPIVPRSILAEGQMPGAVLDCDTPAGRKVLRGGGVAGIRPEPVVGPETALAPGGSATVDLPLGPGAWFLEAPYDSPFPIEVTGPGLRATLPANLDHPGPRWPIGRVVVDGRGPTTLTFSAERDPLLAPADEVAELASVVASRDAPDRIVPVRLACGRYVDWYRSKNP